ncbi:hypothetical protein [Paracoccus sp. (in: a-proteobacteria)]|uniref:hypothetical protein n=1 Tax=Paracoccus sp. TaxID=267 RepID=UPI003A8B4FCF
MNKHAAPEFAMSFTQDAVLLERRDGLNWHLLGEAPFAGRNLGAALKALRADTGPAPEQPDTVLVIPDEQILYTRLTVSPGADLPPTIARALEGMTSFQADELVFDWCPDVDGKIDSLRVAVVARSTLEEAEEFALAQGFRPVGFVARPGDDRFDGQPDFGGSRQVPDHRAPPPVSRPDLHQAAITSDRIEIDDTEVAPPVISRIVPHYVAPQPPRQAADMDLPQTPVTPVADDPPKAGAAPVTNKAAPVIRHGEQRKERAPGKLSPRAEAVHARAAEARARRPVVRPDEDTRHDQASRLRHLKPGPLATLIGLLAVGLLAVLLFVGGEPENRQIADAAAPPPQQDSAAPEAVAAPVRPLVTTSAEPPSAASPAAVTPAAATAAPPAAESAPAPEKPGPTADATAPATSSVAAQTPPEPVAPVGQTVLPPDDPLTAALAEALGDNAVAQTSPPSVPARTIAQAEPPAAITTPAAPAEAPPVPAPAPKADTNVRSGTAPAAIPAQAKPAPLPEPVPPAARAARQPKATPPAPPPGLRTSARPPHATPEQAQPPAAPDARPAVPTNPLPYTQRNDAAPEPMAARRPPARPARPALAAPASSESATSEPAAPQPAKPASGMSQRPPARPAGLSQREEGSLSEEYAPPLTATERAEIQQLLRDLRVAQAGANGLSQAEGDALARLAKLRPQRRPVAVNAPAENAVRNAVAEAVGNSARPPTRGGGNASAVAPPPAATPASASTAGVLQQSVRPQAKPKSLASQSGAGPGSSSLSNAAVEEAIAAAVSNGGSASGAVALTALSSSLPPPRRSGGNRSAAAATAPSGPSDADLRAAAEAQAAEQRRMDAELQAQAEARIRARAAADARAEADARAQAEARARAQAEAEARAAAARKQTYTPPEAENEPDVALKVPEGRSAPSVSAAATVKDGIQISRTQIIGTIGAGKASRALVRLSNGKIITLRLGDRINGGTITAIGNSQITFVKGGSQQQLSVLNGQ